MTVAILSVSEVVSLFHSPADAATERSSDREQPLHARQRRPAASGALALTQSTRATRRLRTRLGMQKEEQGLNAYTAFTGREVHQKNDTTRTVTVNLGEGRVVQMCGRPDGICHEIGAIVEHKYRPCGLIGRALFADKIQCHLYMKMFDLRLAHLVETFNMHIQVHEIDFDDLIWETIRRALVRETNRCIRLC